MDATDLTLLLSGIELTSVKRRRRYSFDSRAASAARTERLLRNAPSSIAKTIFRILVDFQRCPLWRFLPISLS